LKEFAMRWIRHTKLYLIGGVVLLTGSLLGAHYIQQPRHNGDGPNREPQPGNGQRSNSGRGSSGGAYCHGIMAPESEIIPLAPSIYGEVIQVFVQQDQKVKKGDKLLQLDDRQLQSKLSEAIAGVKTADAMLAKAKIAMKTYDLTLLGEEALLTASKKKKAAAEEKLAQARKVANLDSKNAIANDIRAGELNIEELESLIQAQDFKVQGIKLNKPESDVAMAEASVERAKALRDQAQLGVDACLMTAPADGTITQSFVGVGSKFSGQVQKPAFLFYSGGLSVRAEVEQDYASRVKVGQAAEVWDFSNPNQRWRGRVTKVGGSFESRRDTSGIPNLLETGNQERVLVCRITLESGDPLPILNQKLHVHIAPQ
jgi:membrane fusion protein (multidrug efflux system)